MILIAGDIGGTTSRFQWLDTLNANQLSTPVYYTSSDFPSFTALLLTLVHEHQIPPIDVACFGLPGPINDTTIDITNLPWQINPSDVKTALNCDDVVLLNDFHAIALGLKSLDDEALICLYSGQHDEHGNRLIVGAGTGFGVAPVCHIGQQFYPQPSEGGHIAFAPVNRQQEMLLAWAHRDCAHISYEYFLSGKGLQRLYQFCCEGHDICSKDLTAAHIQRQAECGEESAVEALRLFVMIYGQFIGDLALIWPARAGIYIAGGIGAKISSWMMSADFKDSFLAKNEMSKLVATMPVYLIVDEHVGLAGALAKARDTATSKRLNRDGEKTQ